MRRLLNICVLILITGRVEGRTNSELLKIHQVRLDGFPLYLANLTNEWLKHSALGWKLVDDDSADGILYINRCEQEERTKYEAYGEFKESGSTTWIILGLDKAHSGKEHLLFDTTIKMSWFEAEGRIWADLSNSFTTSIYCTRGGSPEPADLVRGLKRIESSVVNLRKKQISRK